MQILYKPFIDFRFQYGVIFAGQRHDPEGMALT
jgi:hypothetical protein